MGRVISAPMVIHLQGDTTKLAACWKVTPQGRSATGYTSHTSDLVIGGVTFKASSGVVPSALSSKEGTGIDNLEVVGLLGVDSLQLADIANGLYDYADVEIFLVNYTDLSMNTIALGAGNIGEISAKSTTFRAEFRALMQRAVQQFVRLTSISCRATLYTPPCVRSGLFKDGKTEADYTFSDTVNSVGAQPLRQFTSNGLAGKPATDGVDYFAFGTLLWNTGANTGVKSQVKSYNTATGEFLLQQRLRQPILGGDTFTVKAGCDLRPITCHDKFHNMAHFDGEPWIPGNDSIIDTPRA